jgi:TetR/AcrR family transcriptional regulator
LSQNLAKERIAKIVKTRRRQQRAVDTRERILAAAYDEFAERGYDGASTRSVAARAGVQHPLVAYHFDGKEGLWRALMTAVSFNFLEHFKEHIDDLSDDDNVARLRRLQEEFIRFAAKNPQFHWLMSHEGKRASERLTWLVEERVKSYFDVIVRLIRSAQRAGRYVAGDPYHLQYLFIGAVTRMFMLSAEVEQVMGRSPFSPKLVEEHVRACLDLFFRDAPAAGGRKKAGAARAKR